MQGSAKLIEVMERGYDGGEGGVRAGGIAQGGWVEEVTYLRGRRRRALVMRRRRAGDGCDLCNGSVSTLYAQ